MRDLTVTEDSNSTPLYCRLISDSTKGKLAEQGVVYSIEVPSDAQVVVCSGAVPFLVSASTFTYPSGTGEDISNGVLLSPGALRVENLTNLYYATTDSGLINFEFYWIKG